MSAEKKAAEVVMGNGQFVGKGDSKAGIEVGPQTYLTTIIGTSSLLFHRYDCAAVDAKGKAKKNSSEKKTDNVESYVYRCDDGGLGFPGLNMQMALAHAARSRQDPRSPRKMASDLVKATVFITPEMIPFGKTTWDYEDMRRAVVQRAGITRTRPALRAGWELTFEITVLEPTYINETFLFELLESAGKFSGICDYRPQFGRFHVAAFKRII